MTAVVALTKPALSSKRQLEILKFTDCDSGPTHKLYWSCVTLSCFCYKKALSSVADP